MLQLGNIQVRSFDQACLDIYWDVTGGYGELADYDLFILRSEAEFGTFSPITPAFRNADRFRDTAVPGYASFYNRLFYKVRATHRTTGATADFPEQAGVRLAAKPDLIAMEMSRMLRLRLREHGGRQIWVFPKRHAGQRCSVCFDNITKTKMRSNCLACYGTTWVGGFYAPVEVFANIVSPAESVVNSPQGKIAVEDTMMELDCYPELAEGDVVVEAENVRWRVGSRIEKVRKGRALVKQMAPIHRLSVNDIEFALPINLTEEELRNLQATPARNYTNPQSLGSASLDSAIIGLFGGR